MTKAIPRFPDVIDSTIMMTAVLCMEKVRNEYILRLSPLAISPHLHAGGAIARGLEVFRQSFYGEGKSEEASILDMFRAFVIFWGDYEPPRSKTGLEHPKSFINTFNALLSYLKEYPPATDKVQPYRGADNKPAIEYTFAIPIPIMHPDTGEQILYAGRFDMIGEMAKSLWIVDEKTTKGFGENWSEQWSLRSQFLGYTWAARLYDYPYIEGAIIRGIAMLKGSFGHREAIIPIHQWQVDRWEIQMVRNIQRMVDAYTSGVWDMAYGDACSMYGGCEFQPLCTSPEPVKWYNLYVERIWNPLDKNPTAEGDSNV